MCAAMLSVAFNCYAECRYAEWENYKNAVA
jgi:hypothetical protein